MVTRRRLAPPTVVCLVRHASTPTTGKVLPGRAPGLHLSAEGREEAERTATRLAGLRGLAALYTSPLERARETAAVIGRATGLRPRVERGLLECDFGEWTGAELAVLSRSPEWPVVVSRPSTFRFPGGESFVELEARVVTTIERLVGRHQGEVIIAVSHADPIKVALGHALGAPLDAMQRIQVSPASVSAIAYGPRGPLVLAQNVADGLQTLRVLGAHGATRGRSR
ncbi:MAG TPA: histidine phosphatase family protein [Acidimicrobiales bacterium]|nr:histidine phosphatase family protein [Acidimicrobiales bacterium]